MMHFYIMTLFPEMVLNGLHTSIIGRAEEKGYISIEAFNIRDYTLDKHKKVDDYPYGGGAGMLMQAQPVYDCWQTIDAKIKEQRTYDNTKKTRVVYVTPQGEVFHQQKAIELSKEEIVTDYISIGDYVLTGGELPAMVLIDAIARLVPGVLSNHESAQTESHSNGLLEYPQYSRPELWHEKRVPEVLLSGHHANIEKWRAEQSIKRTKERRPDLFEAYEKANK